MIWMLKYPWENILESEVYSGINKQTKKDRNVVKQVQPDVNAKFRWWVLGIKYKAC